MERLQPVLNLTNEIGVATALKELNNLKFSISSLIQHYPKGSYEKELHELALTGIHRILDLCHSAFQRELFDNQNIIKKLQAKLNVSES